MTKNNRKRLPRKEQRAAFKRLLGTLRPYRLFIAVSLLAAAVSVAGQLLIPIETGRAIDQMLGKSGVNFPMIGKILLLIGLYIGLSAFAQWILGICNNRAAFHVARDLRDRCMEKIGHLPLSYLDTHPTGDLVSRVIADVELLSDGLLMGFTQFFSGILTIVGTLFFMLVVNWVIALVVICVTPLSLLVAAFIAKKTFRYFHDQSEARGGETALVSEHIDGMKVIHAFGWEEKSQAAFEQVDEELEKRALKATFYSSLTNPSTRFVNSVVYAGVVLAGSLNAILGGSITVGRLSIFLSYANQYTKPFNEISGVITEMQNALACASRIFEFLDAEEEAPDKADARVFAGHPEGQVLSAGSGGSSPVSDPNGNVPAVILDGHVALANVAFRYVPETPLIERFSLEVRPGQRVAIVGPTGCGKTTLINLLMRFYDVNKGSIRVSGVDIRDVQRRSLRASYGMVLQDTWLKAGTIAENIAYGCPDAGREQIVAAAKEARAHGFICRLPNGYDTVIAEDGGQLSQGEKQLLCIARVMLSLPPMLILDEATSSIDTRTEMKIQEAFARMMQGRTSFIVAHRLSTIREADVILVMRDGHIVEQGNHDELLAAGGFYARLYNAQFEGMAI